jgi:hypothetical protein
MKVVAINRDAGRFFKGSVIVHIKLLVYYLSGETGKHENKDIFSQNNNRLSEIQIKNLLSTKC